MALRSGNEFAKNMTKREAFAMAAMQGFIASNRLTNADVNDEQHDRLIASWSVEVADALIAALAKDAQP